MVSSDVLDFLRGLTTPMDTYAGAFAQADVVTMSDLESLGKLGMAEYTILMARMGLGILKACVVRDGLRAHFLRKGMAEQFRADKD